MNDFDFIKPGTLDEVIEATSKNDGAACIAGGTNLIDLWKYNITHPSLVVDLNNLSLHSISEKDNGVTIGALATNADTAYHPLIISRYPLLSKAILAGASAQIRNMATNGGNLLQRTRCYYFYDPEVPCNKRVQGSGCPARTGYNRIHAILGTSEDCIAVFPSDMCVALAALEAVIHVTGVNGDRAIPLNDFHRLPGNTPGIDNNLQPGEIIISIELPGEGFHQNYSYLKIRDRHSYAFALVSVATGFKLDGETIKEARIALGGVAHKPWRREEAEHFLSGRQATADNFGKAADILMEGAVGFEHNAFKIGLARTAIIRNCEMALNPETQLPGAQPSL